jgi:molybdopterin-containing oxidoreductase family iron-sulfur binding subunit
LGQPVETRYDFSKADVILALDADFLYAGFPASHAMPRDFAKRRNPDAGEMSRLYVAESTPSSTGAKADHRLPVRAVEIESFVRALDMMLGDDTDRSMVRAEQQKFLDAVLADLKSHRGSSR